jgi:hypothetical protein
METGASAGKKSSQRAANQKHISREALGSAGHVIAGSIVCRGSEAGRENRETAVVLIERGGIG